MLLRTSGASLLGNMLSGKGIVKAGYENKEGKGMLRAGYGFERPSIKDLWFKKKLIPPHHSTNTEIQKYYRNEPRFTGVYSRDNLPEKIKDGASAINLDEYADAGTHWIASYVLNIGIIYFESFRVEHVPIEIKKFIGQKNIKTNKFRIQANNSIMCGYFCIGFVDFMLAGKNLIDYTSLFSPYDLK